ncbi:MAG: hypothetical protein J6M39_09430 [Lachnospiraceae bacterium]|nr:hypothetical protein [Lachnospiraceae bacterium]
MYLIKKKNKFLKSSQDANFNKLPFEQWIWTERKALAKQFTTYQNAKLEVGTHEKVVRIIGGKNHEQNGMENEKTPEKDTI